MSRSEENTPPRAWPPLYSTSLTSNRAFAQAEHMARHSREFESQAGRQLPIVVVRNLSLEEALGGEYLQHVAGRVRSDPATRTTEDVAFDDGRVLAWYVAGTAGYQLLTLYPAPARLRNVNQTRLLIAV